MINSNSKLESTPPPLPGKPQYKPAIYAKLILGIAILANATAQVIGEEFGPEAAGALLGSVVIMPAILLAIALLVWRVSGRDPHPANLVLATLSAIYLLLSLVLLGNRLLIPQSVGEHRVSQRSAQDDLPGVRQ